MVHLIVLISAGLEQLSRSGSDRLAAGYNRTYSDDLCEVIGQRLSILNDNFAVILLEEFCKRLSDL